MPDDEIKKIEKIVSPAKKREKQTSHAYDEQMQERFDTLHEKAQHKLEHFG